MNLNRKNILLILSLTLLVLTVFLSLSLVEKRQEIRKEAFSPSSQQGAIEILINPLSGTNLIKGSTVNFTLSIKNRSTVLKEVYVVGIDLNYNPSEIDPKNVNCNNQIFPLVIKNEVNAINKKIFLTCARNPGSEPLKINPGQIVALGNFQATILTNTSSSTTSLIVTRGVIPNASNPNEDLAIQPPTFQYQLQTSVQPSLTPFPGAPNPCPKPSTPILLSPLNNSQLAFTPDLYVDLRVKRSSEKCGSNKLEYWIEFDFPYNPATNTYYNRYQTNWIQDGATPNPRISWNSDYLQWHTGPYGKAGTARWRVKTRYYDNLTNSYKESDWSNYWYYLIK